MLLHVLVRAGWLVASLVLASILVFSVVNILPGDVAVVILGTAATDEAVQTLRSQLGLNQPAWLRYLEWVGGMLRSDFGTSLLSHSDVGPLIIQKLSVSGPLALASAVISVVVALPLGVLAGVRYRHLSGAVISAVSLLGIAVPAFWAGLLLATVFAIQLRLFPAGGFVEWSESPLGAIRSLVLPAFALGLVQGDAVLEVATEFVLDGAGFGADMFLKIRICRRKAPPWLELIARSGLRAVSFAL